MILNNEAGFRLRLIGPFRLEGPDGARIEIASKRGQALIAMLAIAGGGERSRGWLQDRLWGSRAPEQAAASLRRELSNLRQLINRDGHEMLSSAHGRVWINLEKVDADCRSLDYAPAGELLEGIDISGEEMFEDWLRDERARLSRRAISPTSPLKRAPAETREPIADFSARPAIAVLPFSWIPASAEKEVAAQGISEDLIDRLSKLRWLPIIARSSSFALAPEQHDPRVAGAALGARYIVEGAIRDGNLSVSLNDAQNGECLWNGRSILPTERDAASLEAILAGITATLGLQIDQSEQHRALQKAQDELNVRELIWRGRWHLNRFTPEDARIARECFDKALSLEPNFSEALVQSTWSRLWDLWATRGDEGEIRAVRKMAQTAIIADHDDARGYMLAGIAEIWLRQPVRAEALLQKSISLNPSLVLAHSELGSVQYLKGQPEAAVATLNFAMRLSPNDHTLFYTLGELAVAHLMLGNFDAAADHADKAIMRRSAYWYAHVVKINAFARNGQEALARSALADLYDSNGGFKEEFIDWLPFIDRSWNDFLKVGLNLVTA